MGLTMDIMAQLLDEVKTIIVKDHAESFKQGKEFNVFYIQGTASKEVKVCRFIRELLDPNGSHGQGTLFLNSFVKNVLKIDESTFLEDDYSKAQVTREVVIDESRRIDLLIRIKDRFFPIEVKVYAKDQDKQCIDYYNYAVNKDSNAKIYYLTLDGHKPSDDSKGTLDKSQIECIAFSDEILKWLDECIVAEEISQIYSVRELLIQFRSVIRDLTGMQKGKRRMEIKEKIESSYDNVMAAVQIANTLPDIKADKMKEVFRCIKEHMEKYKELEISEDWDNEIDTYYGSKKKTWPGLSYKIPVEDSILKGKLRLRFEVEESLYFGICPQTPKAKISEAGQYVQEKLTPPCLDGKNLDKVHSDSDSWYWWAYVHKDNPVNYWCENNNYWKLFDETYFDEYMNEIYTTIDSVAKSILG